MPLGCLLAARRLSLVIHLVRAALEIPGAEGSPNIFPVAIPVFLRNGGGFAEYPAQSGVRLFMSSRCFVVFRRLESTFVSSGFSLSERADGIGCCVKDALRCGKS